MRVVGKNSKKESLRKLTTDQGQELVLETLAGCLLPMSPLHLASPGEVSLFPAKSAWSGFVKNSTSQEDWGERDYTGCLVIRKESSSPLNAGYFIWSQKTELASIVSTELVDKRSTPEGNSLQG